MEHSLQPILPIFLLVACVVGLVVGLLIVANIFNPVRPGGVARMPYESGMDPIHDTRRRFDVRFYLLAIAFLVFDVELLFLYPWAVASRPAMAAATPGSPSAPAQDAVTTAARPATSLPAVAPGIGIDAAVADKLVESRHLVFGATMTFVALLVLGFVYDWRKGVFQWR